MCCTHVCVAATYVLHPRMCCTHVCVAPTYALHPRMCCTHVCVAPTYAFIVLKWSFPGFLVSRAKMTACVLCSVFCVCYLILLIYSCVLFISRGRTNLHGRRGLSQLGGRTKTHHSVLPGQVWFLRAESLPRGRWLLWPHAIRTGRPKMRQIIRLSR